MWLIFTIQPFRNWDCVQKNELIKENVQCFMKILLENYVLDWIPHDQNKDHFATSRWIKLNWLSQGWKCDCWALEQKEKNPIQTPKCDVRLG